MSSNDLATTPPSAKSNAAANAAASDSRSLWKRLAFGFSSQFVNLFVFVVSRILLVPLFIHAWGVSLYSDWLVLMALALLLQLLVMGQHVKFGNEIRHAWARRDVGTMNAAFRSANGFWLVWVPVIIFVSFAFFFIFDLSSILNLKQIKKQEAALVLVLLLISSINSCYQIFNRSIYQAQGLFARGELIVASSVAIDTLIVASILFFGGSIIAVAVVQGVVMPIISSAIVFRDILRRFPELRLSIRVCRQSMPSWRDIYDYGVPQAADIVSSNALMLILGLVNAPSLQVVQFGLARTATNMMRLLIRPIVALVAMEANRLRIQEDHQRQRQIDHLGVLAGAVLAGSIAGALVGSGDVVYEVWTGGEVPVDVVLLGLVALHTCAWSLGLFVVNLLRFGGESCALARPATFNVLGYCILGYGAASLFGAYGLLTTASALDALLMFVVPAYAVQQRMGIAMWRTVGLGIAVGITTFAVSFTVCEQFWALVW